MAEASIDRLAIEIQARATDAQRAVRGLASDLGKVGTKGQSAASGLSAAGRAARSLDGAQVIQFADGLARLNGVRLSSTIGKNLSAAAAAAGQIGDVSGLSQLAGSLARLDGVKVSASIANQLERLPQALSAISAMDVDMAKLSQLQQAVASLSTLPKSNLATTISQLRKLPEAVAALDSIDMSSFAEKCRQLSDALGQLPQKMSAVARGFGAVKASGASMRSALSSGSGSSGGLFGGAGADADSLRQRLKSVAYDIRNVTIVYGALKGISNKLAQCLDLSNQFIEDMNLADTSLGQYAQGARDYADQVKSVLGLDTGAWLRNQGVFMSMAQGMGVASDKAYTMSQGLTQLGYDLASFFNISNDEAMQKLQSGLSGEIEPLRRLGYDLTEARLQQEAYNLGISESVSNMTQAEKAMLRYEAIMNQVSWAQGDMAKTISSPSNMLRVLQDNVSTAARSIGNVFLPMLQAILPVAIAAAKVVATLANMLADLTGGSQIAAIEFGAGDAGESAAGGLNDMADAAGKAGKNAGSAAKQAKELKRQLMGFDEINMFSKQSSGSGSGGGGGNGGSGGGGNGASSIPVQSYDFLGDATGLGDDLYNAIMDAVARAGKAFAPLVESAKVVAQAILRQFEGLDISGAMVNAVMGAVNLVSNAARNVIEVLGPLAVAFNFPETIALYFDLAAQACLTLSAAINAVGSMVKGFTDTALVQLAAWIGEKVRGAIYLCIGVLQDWQDWFQRNTQALNLLGQYAGVAAGLVLRLAEAVADGAFAVAAVAFRALTAVLQVLLGLLVNSGVARAAVTLLGGALTAMAVSNGIAAGLQSLSNAFEKMAERIATGSEQSADKVKILSTSLGDNMSRAAGNLKASLQMLGEALGIVKDKSGQTKTATEKASDACADAAKSVQQERDRLNEMQLAAASSGKKLDSFKAKTQAMRTKTAEANLALAESKEGFAKAASAASEYMAAQGKTASGIARVTAEEGKAAAAVAASTAKKAASTAATGAMTVATGAATVMQNLWNAAVAAFPGMILAAALGGILDIIMQLVGDPLMSFIKGMLGLDDATGDVTDTTEEANQVLSEEQQQISDNVESIREYEKGHDSLADALAASRMSEEQFAAYLQQTGQTFDEVSQAQDQFVDKTVNGFEAIDTSTQLSLESVNKNLQKNLDTQSQWSEDLQTLMAQTGKGANDSLIKSLTDAGPEKMAQALHEVVTNPASEQSQEFLALMEQTGDLTGPTLAAAIAGGSSAASGATGMMMDDVNDTIAEGGQQTASTAESVDQQTVQQFGSHYNEAKDAGRNLAGGFGDGIREAAQDAVRPAQDAMRSVVQGLNGGTGYREANSAGRNMMGGFVDGLAQGMGNQAWWKGRDAATSAQSGMGSNYWGAYDAGKNMGWGFNDGLVSTQQTIYKNAEIIARNAANRMRRALDIHSPSRVTREIGMYFDLGMAGGIASYAKSVTGEAGRLASDALDATDAARGAGEAAGSAFGDGLSGALSVAQDAYAAAASGSWRLDYSARAPHARAAAGGDDADMAQAVAYGVSIALASAKASSGQSGQRGGDTTVVLRVGAEDIARAVMRGSDSLARRGVVEFS